MTSDFEPFHEPPSATLLRTFAIAVVVAGLLTVPHGDLHQWPIAILLVLWPSFGGHWVELFFLNFLRPRLPASRAIQILARLITWFIGGTLLALGAALTAVLLIHWHPSHWPAWWIAGLGFIALELIVHLTLQLRRQPSFFNGRG